MTIMFAALFQQDNMVTNLSILKISLYFSSKLLLAINTCKAVLSSAFFSLKTAEGMCTAGDP